MALVLTRNVGEMLRIGEAKVTIGAVRGEQVKLVIEAPAHIHVSRGEFPEAEHAERQRAKDTTRAR